MTRAEGNAYYAEELFAASADRDDGHLPAGIAATVTSAANRAAWEALSGFEKPFLTVFGDRDPFTAGAERAFQRKIPGARGKPHIILPNAAHFIQEDAANDLARIIVSFVKDESAA